MGNPNNTVKKAGHRHARLDLRAGAPRLSTPLWSLHPQDSGPEQPRAPSWCFPLPPSPGRAQEAAALHPSSIYMALAGRLKQRYEMIPSTWLSGHRTENRPTQTSADGGGYGAGSFALALAKLVGTVGPHPPQSQGHGASHPAGSLALQRTVGDPSAFPPAVAPGWATRWLRATRATCTASPTAHLPPPPSPVSVAGDKRILCSAPDQ